MKIKIVSTVVVALIALISFAANISAQTSTFTHTGGLSDGGVPANGVYDFQFALYDAVTNGNQVGVSLTNATTLVSNGVFTVDLDFGSAVFDGSGRWLETGVRTNGSTDPYVILSPRETITSVPYAVQAAKANYVAATNIDGTLSLAQLPIEVVTNNATGVNLSGSFSGNGNGLINVPGATPVQVVSATNATLQVNMSYLLTNSASTHATLPASPNVGDIITVSGVGSDGWQVDPNLGQTILGGQREWIARETNHTWQCVASSADGTKLVAAESYGSIWRSTNSGVNWTQSFSTNLMWNCLASSADGVKLVVAANSGQIFGSSDSGTTWVQRFNSNAPFADWKAIACGTNGTRLVAVDYGGRIYTSANSGLSWIPRESDRLWISVASSGNGTKLVALVDGGQVYTSTDIGVSWTPQGNSNLWSAVASSVDGTNLVAVDQLSLLYTSADAGVTWTLRYTNAVSWGAVASSADGARLIAGSLSGPVYRSSNSGVDWTPHDVNRSWTSLASSADGTNVVAVADGQILTSAGVSSLGGPAGSSVTLQYIGNGQWQALGQMLLAPGATVGGNGIGLLNGTNVFSGTNQFNGVVLATNANNHFAGDGGNLINLNASTISAGTLVDARLSSNVALLNGANVFANTNQFAGVVQATNANNQFAGDGGGLANLNATTIATGTIADARLSSNVALVNAANVLTGSNQFAGVVIATNANNQFSGNGGNLTNLNATTIATGTIADARLSSNVALVNAANVLTASNQFAGVVIATNANNQFSGNGGNLTNLNATTIATGTIADARLSTNVALVNAANVLTASNQFTGVVIATNGNNQFSGNGGGLSNLNATTIATGTIADARLSSNVALANGANVFSASNRFAGIITATNGNNQFSGNGGGLTNLNATTIATGTIADARLSSNVALANGTNVFSASNRFAGIITATNGNNQFSGNGGGLTSLNAAAIATGTLADARLSSNVALDNSANVFTASNRFAGVAIVTNANNQISGNGSGLTSLTAGNLSGTILQANLGTANSYAPVMGNGSANFILMAQSGYYAKIGNLVYFETWLVWTNKGSATTGNLCISLPTTYVSARPVFNVGYLSGITFSRQLVAVPNGSTTMTLSEMSSVGGGATPLSVTNCGSSGELQITGTYRWQ